MLVEEKIKENAAFVYTTCSGVEEARSIGLAAMAERLAVCADFWKTESVYPWEGVVQQVDQYMLMLTTERSRADKLAEFIKGMHSYSLPMVAVCDVATMSPSYMFWMERALEGEPPQMPELNVNGMTPDENGYTIGKLK